MGAMVWITDHLKQYGDLTIKDFFFLLIPILGTSVINKAKQAAKKAETEKDAAEMRTSEVKTQLNEAIAAFRELDLYVAPTEFKVMGMTMRQHAPEMVRKVVRAHLPDRILEQNTTPDAKEDF